MSDKETKKTDVQQDRTSVQSWPNSGSASRPTADAGNKSILSVTDRYRPDFASKTDKLTGQ